jgi:hypothetical protein
MQVRKLGGAIGNIKGPITPGVTEIKLQLHSGPFFADTTIEKKDRSERLAASHSIFSDKAAMRRGGDHKRGPLTCQ